MQSVSHNIETSEAQPAWAAPSTPQPTRRPRSGWLSRLLGNRKAMVGLTILGLFAAIAIVGPVLAPTDPNQFVGLPNQPPSAQHWLGTTGQGQDVAAQLAWGTRVSLLVGLIVGLLATATGTLIGIAAAYFGGVVDEVLSLVMNIFLIIPGLPLLVALAAFLPPSSATTVFVLAITGWAWTARVLRAQTLSIRDKDFVSAALVTGANSRRIMFREILPNMASIVVGALLGSIIYGITAQAALQFLGLGNIGTVSWGTILYWADNNAALEIGAWWTFLPAGLCIALVAFALAMMNYAMDEITNPRLRTERETVRVLDKRAFRAGHATPVIRDQGR